MGSAAGSPAGPGEGARRPPPRSEGIVSSTRSSSSSASRRAKARRAWRNHLRPAFEKKGRGAPDGRSAAEPRSEFSSASRRDDIARLTGRTTRHRRSRGSDFSSSPAPRARRGAAPSHWHRPWSNRPLRACQRPPGQRYPFLRAGADERSRQPALSSAERREAIMRVVARYLLQTTRAGVVQARRGARGWPGETHQRGASCWARWAGRGRSRGRRERGP